MKTTLSSCLAAAFAVPCSLHASLGEWQLAVSSASPATTYTKDADGPAISGFEPLDFDVGSFTGPRSFEFIVNAGNTGASSALMGLAGLQALKFEQYPDTGHPGITAFGIADYDATAATPFYQDAHVVFASDGTDTRLYVNGAEVETFAGAPLELSGLVTLAAVTDGAGSTPGDRLDGHILGFASYDRALTPAEVTTHYTQFAKDRPPVSLAAWRNAVTSAGTAPATTVFSPVSGMAPVLTDLGEVSGPVTLEFIVNAGEAGASEAMMGRSGLEGLKFDQWNNTGVLGLTQFGVADHSSPVPCPYNEITQVTWVYDGSSTALYVNGELQHTFDGVPVNLTGIVGLGAAATVTGLGGVTTYRDPLDGQVLRFASYDNALSPEEVSARFSAFQADAGAQVFTAWQSEVNTGIPSTVITDPTFGSDQRTIDVGQLSGDRTFEFIVNAGLGTASGSLLGGNSQAIKFEQWNDTGSLGITQYGVSDFNSFIPAPELVDTHIVYVSNGTDTDLYVDGVFQYTFTGVALTGTGQQGLATAAALPIISATWFDRMDGHVLGFASYADTLPPEEISAHYSALTSTVPVPAAPFVITGITRDATSGAITLTWASEDGATYRIDYSETPAAFPGTAVPSVAATFGGTTSATFPAPSAAGRLFFRIVRL